MTTNHHLGEGDDINKGVKKALIIGVSDYEDKSLESLQFCKNDAEEMYEILTSPELGFEIPDSNKMVGKVKDKEMKKAIVRFFKDSSITSQDTLLFYFAGHGVTDNSGEVFMASSEIDSKEPFNGGFPFRQLTKWMNESYSTRIITTLDCCHSGAFELTTGSRGDPNEAAKKAYNDMEDKSNALRQGRGKCLIAASESTQRAYEIKEKNHGIFTYYLLEGLNGKPQSVDDDGNVTVDRLADYVYDAISSLPPEKKPNQMPIRKAEGGGRIFLAYHPALARRQQVPSGGQTPKKEDSILQFIEEARMFLEQEQYDKAIKTFDGILMLRSGHIEALNGKGVALCKQKKYEEALECFKEVLQIKPRHAEASVYVDMITDRIRKERSGEAKASSKDIKQDAALEKRTEKKVIKALNESTQTPSYDSETVLRADPRNPYNDPTLPYYKPSLDKKDEYSRRIQKLIQQEVDALIDKGATLESLGKFEAAIQSYDKAIKKNPNHDNAWNNKGAALNKLGRYQEAIECYDKVIEINPNHEWAWYNKGTALHGLHRYEAAIECYDKAIKLNPNDGYALDNKGIALGKLGKYEDAIAYHDKAIKLNPNHALAWNNKGIALDKLGRNKDARECYKKARELGYRG